ncbi:MAG: hypothetical protein ABIP06_03075, partial [Pyrinomonadaceae bacterium]
MLVSAESNSEIVRLRKQIAAGEKVISLSGLTSIPSKAFVLSHLQRETNKTFIIIADSNKELESWECDLDFWSKDGDPVESKIENRKS